MKAKIMAMLLIPCGLVAATTNNPPPRPAAPAAPADPAPPPLSSHFRLVDGKIYNIMLSTNWTYLPSPRGKLEIVQLLTNGAICTAKMEIIKTNRVVGYEASGTNVFVKNIPAVANGVIVGARVMRAGTTNIGDKTYPAYDYGILNSSMNWHLFRGGGPVNGGIRE
jgi:hypothetical protein